MPAADELNQFGCRVKRTLGLHESLARQFGEGQLWCPLCLRTKTVGLQAMSRYLREGWPECCGQTMHLRRRA